jgi:uncharacterized membrane protein YgcG
MTAQNANKTHGKTVKAARSSMSSKRGSFVGVIHLDELRAATAGGAAAAAASSLLPSGAQLPHSLLWSDARGPSSRLGLIGGTDGDGSFTICPSPTPITPDMFGVQRPNLRQLLHHPEQMLNPTMMDGLIPANVPSYQQDRLVVDDGSFQPDASVVAVDAPVLRQSTASTSSDGITVNNNKRKRSAPSSSPSGNGKSSSGGKKSKRWTWKKPPGKPKRPLSAYNL